MAIALLLIIFGIFTRLSPEHVDNLVPIGALALYAGARLARKWALIVPLAIMIASDVVIDVFFYPEFQRGIFDPSRLTIYGCYLFFSGLGMGLCRRELFLIPIASAFFGAFVFFVVTNLAAWASGYSLQPATFEGLVRCYQDAIPFFRNSFVGTMGGAVGLFGIDAIARILFRREPAPTAQSKSLATSAD